MAAFFKMTVFFLLCTISSCKVSLPTKSILLNIIIYIANVSDKCLRSFFKMAADFKRTLILSVCQMGYNFLYNFASDYIANVIQPELCQECC